MAEILHFEILRKHGQTHKQTHKQTDRHGHYNTSPSPYGGEVTTIVLYYVSYDTISDIAEDLIAQLTI